MTQKQVPFSPAYLVSHDINGAMDIYPWDSYEAAVQEASDRNDKAESLGFECNWRAYIKLPRVRILAFHHTRGSL